MPTDPVDQLRALGNAFDDLVPPVRAEEIGVRRSVTGRSRIAVRVFAAAAAAVTLVAVGAIVLHRSDGGNEIGPVDSAAATSTAAGTAPVTDDVVVHHDPSDILVATPEARSLSAAQMAGYNVVAADAAYSLPDGALAYQPIGDTAVWVRSADGRATKVVSPPTGTHLILYDAGTALGKPVILYATVAEDDNQAVTLHIVGADGTDDRALGEIGFWEGWVTYARLSGDVVTTEEFTVTQGFVMRFDLATGQSTNVNNLTLTFPADSADGTVSAHIEDGALVVHRLSGAEVRTPVAGGTDAITSLEPSTSDVIVNRSTDAALVLRDTWSGHPTLEPMPFAGTASFIEHGVAVPATDDLATAQATWHSAGVTAYNLALTVQAQIAVGPIECEFAVSDTGSQLVRGPIRVDVGAGTRTIDTDLAFCRTVPSTVEGLLQLIAEHRADGHADRASFDGRGVPTDFTLDTEMEETDGALHYRVTVTDPPTLPTVALSARDYLQCGPTDGPWIEATVTADVIGVTARVVVDDQVFGTSAATTAPGTVDVSFSPFAVAVELPRNPYGKTGVLQVINADGYVLASKPLILANPPGVMCG